MRFQSRHGLAFCASIVVLAAMVLPTVLSAQSLEPGEPRLEVKAVEQRSACDTPFEWFVQVRNLSNKFHFRVRVDATVLASIHNDPRCTLEHGVTFELAPGACNSIQRPFYNGPGAPCDVPCCDLSDPNCNICTTIQNAKVYVLAYSLDGVKWIDKEMVVCLIENNAIVEGDKRYCSIFNSCVKGVSVTACSF